MIAWFIGPLALACAATFSSVALGREAPRMPSAFVEGPRSVTRPVTDQALGVIMAQERCTQARAFAILRAASQNTKVKLGDIAGEIVTGVSGERPAPPPPLEDG